MINMDTIISDCQQRVKQADDSYTVYGRAMLYKERWNDKTVQVPRVYHEGEYINPLPDDAKGTIVFFQAVGAEKYGQYEVDNIGQINRQVALTWWGKIENGLSLENVKFSIIERLQECRYVQAIVSYVDERYQDVFPDFTGYLALADTEQRTQWLMAPYSGLRLVFNVAYRQERSECL